MENPNFRFFNLLFIAFIFLIPFVSFAANSPVLLEINGSIFPKDSFPSECSELFKGGKCEAKSYGSFHVESVKEKDEIFSKSVFSSSEGAQVIEQSWEKNGHVRKAIIENKVLNKISELEVKEGVAYFQVTDTKEGGVKKSHEKAEDNLVVPSTVMAYVRPYFPQILKGETVKLNVASLDRRQIFKFNMKREKIEKGVDGSEILVMKMEPGNILVKALVSPMYFYVKPKAGEMFAFEGRSALRRKVGDQYKEMDVKTAYHYKINAFENSVKSDTKEIQPCTEEMLKSKRFDQMKCEVKEKAL